MIAALWGLLADIDDAAGLIALALLALTFLPLAGVAAAFYLSRTAHVTRDAAVGRAVDAVIPRLTLSVALLCGIPNVLSYSETLRNPETPVTLARARAALDEDVRRGGEAQGPTLPYSVLFSIAPRLGYERLLATGVFQARRYASPKEALAAEPLGTARRFQLFSLLAVTLLLLPFDAWILFFLTGVAASVEREHRRALARALERGELVARGRFLPSARWWDRARRRGLWETEDGARRPLRLTRGKCPRAPTEGALVETVEPGSGLHGRLARRARRGNPDAGLVFVPAALLPQRESATAARAGLHV